MTLLVKTHRAHLNKPQQGSNHSTQKKKREKKTPLGLGLNSNANSSAEHLVATNPDSFLLFINSEHFIAMVSQLASALGTVLLTYAAVNPVLGPLRQRQKKLKEDLKKNQQKVLETEKSY